MLHYLASVCQNVLASSSEPLPLFPRPSFGSTGSNAPNFKDPVALTRPTNVTNRTYLLNEVHYYRAPTTVHTCDYRRHYLPYERLGPASRSCVAATWYYSRFAFWPKSSFPPQCSLSSPSFPSRLSQSTSSRSHLLVCIRITYSPGRRIFPSRSAVPQLVAFLPPLSLLADTHVFVPMLPTKYSSASSQSQVSVPVHYITPATRYLYIPHPGHQGTQAPNLPNLSLSLYIGRNRTLLPPQWNHSSLHRDTFGSGIIAVYTVFIFTIYSCTSWHFVYFLLARMAQF